MMRFWMATMVLLAGCATAPMDVERVSKHPAKVLSERIAAPYDQVHRRILDGLNYCFMEQPTRRQWVIRDRRDKSARTGQVVLADVYGKTSETVHWVARSEDVSGGTRLVVMVARKGFLPEAELVLRWARGELTCGPFAPQAPSPESTPAGEGEHLSLR